MSFLAARLHRETRSFQQSNLLHIGFTEIANWVSVPVEYTSPKSIGQQVAIMRRHFPQFHYKRIGGFLVWRGVLKPSPKSPEYEIEIDYRIGVQAICVRFISCDSGKCASQV